jgi:hypothetical protein
MEGEEKKIPPEEQTDGVVPGPALQAPDQQAKGGGGSEGSDDEEKKQPKPHLKDIIRLVCMYVRMLVRRLLAWCHSQHLVLLLLTLLYPSALSLASKHCSACSQM